MRSNSRTQGTLVAMAAAALWTLGTVPQAMADSSGSKVKARSTGGQSSSSATRGGSSRATSSRSTASPPTSTRSASPAERSGSKVTPSSRSSSPHVVRTAPSTATRSGDSKIPSRDEVDRGTPRHTYPRHYYYPRHGYGYGYDYGFGYYPYWRSSFYYGAPYYRGWHYGYPAAPYYYRRPGVRSYADYDRGPGALDTDVSPERAEIFVDGQRVGSADDFDGFPSYLWLESGTYDVVIYLDGYRTIARQMTIRSGEIVAVEDEMERGDAQRPEELFATSTERRDDRLARDRERAERAAAEERWREEQGYVPEIDRGYPRDEEESRQAMPLPAGVARIHFSVLPADAAVYLDGHFVGTAEEISRLSAGLIVEPGTHTVEISRPGYDHEVQEVDATADGEVEVEIELDRS